jgi:hypothetical protein
MREKGVAVPSEASSGEGKASQSSELSSVYSDCSAWLLVPHLQLTLPTHHVAKVFSFPHHFHSAKVMSNNN